MDNLVSETNVRLQEIVDDLLTIKVEYEKKLKTNEKEINEELDKVKKYKDDFFTSKEKVEKMNADIEGFEEDYKNLVERFKDDELANILIAANKEISAKIEERKRKIVRDKNAMNDLVKKAEDAKSLLVKLTAEKKALELCLARITDSYDFYNKSISQIIDYSNDNKDNLCACFYEEKSSITFKKEIVIPEENDNFEDDEDGTNITLGHILEEEKEIIENDTEDLVTEVIEESINLDIEEDIEDTDLEDTKELNITSEVAEDIISDTEEEEIKNEPSLVPEIDEEYNDDNIYEASLEEVQDYNDEDSSKDEEKTSSLDLENDFDLENILNYDDSLENEDNN